MARHLALLFVIILGSLAGCTTCSHKAGYLSLRDETCSDPAEYQQRQKVHTIFINGFDPLNVSQIEQVSHELNKNGYAKVYRGEFYHQAFLEKEIRRLRTEDPEARFVIVGYSIGAGVALSLTTRLLNENIPVDALIEIAPVHLPLTSEGQNISKVGRHVLVGQNWQDRSYSRTNTETLLVPNTSHFSVPSHPATVGKILELLKQSTEMAPRTQIESTTTYPLIDDPAPLPGGTITR